MKYLPLVWASIMRKPTRAVLTLLSVMLAFTLFGLTIGMNATFAKFQEDAREDRMFVFARFGGLVPIALGRQIESMPGVEVVASSSFVPGYIHEPKNRVFVQMMDEKVAKVNPEYPITPAQWQLIRNNRQGMLVSKSQADRWHLKAGDTLTIASPSAKKLDGSTSWTFKVAAVTPDMSIFGQGYMFGNYDYMDKARLLSDQGKTGQFRVKVRDASKTVEISQQIESRFANSARRCNPSPRKWRSTSRPTREWILLRWTAMSRWPACSWFCSSPPMAWPRRCANASRNSPPSRPSAFPTMA